MRAWQIQKYAEPGDALALVEVATPAPAPGELRIRVEAAALGLPDVFMCRGSYAFRPMLPFTPGQEVAGTVSAAGEATTIPVGSRVLAVTAFFRGFGGLAEQALALESSTYPAPEEMDAATAAAFAIPYHTAWIGLVTRGRLAAGETLLVLGAAGGSGAAAVQLGVALGARVLAVAGGAARCETCRGFGAHRVIDHTAERLAEAVAEATGGAGADVIYDPVGGPAFDAALRCIASEGRLLAIGHASGAWSDAPTQRLVGRNASVVGVYVGAYDKPFLSEVHAELLGLWRAGRIRSLVSRQIGFEQAAAGLSEVAERRSTGKLVVRIANDPAGEAGA